MPNARVVCAVLAAAVLAASAAVAKDMPPLPDEFTVTLEANIDDSGVSSVLREAYDLAGRRVRREEVSPGVHDVTISDFEAGLEWHVGDHECAVRPTAAGGAVEKLSLFVDAAAHDFEYGGEDEARGIACDRWDAAVVNETSGANYTVSWYFSVPSWSFRRSPDEEAVPIRTRVAGVGDGGAALSHHYEWVDFLPGPPAEGEFDVPDAAHACDWTAAATREVPALPRSYHVVEEFAMPERNRSGVMSRWVDFDGNRVRIEHTPTRADEDGNAADGFVLVLRGDSDTVYYTSPQTGCMTFSPIPLWASNFGYNASVRHLEIGTPFASGGATTETVSDQFYAGQEAVRGIDAHRFHAHVVSEWPGKDGGSVISDLEEDLYFSDETWHFGDNSTARPPVPVGTTVTGLEETLDRDGKVVSARRLHIVSSYVDGFVADRLADSHFVIPQGCPGAVDTPADNGDADGDGTGTGGSGGAGGATEDGGDGDDDDLVGTGAALGIAITFLFLGLAGGFIGARFCCPGSPRPVRGHRRNASSASAAAAGGTNLSHVELVDDDEGAADPARAGNTREH